MAQHDPTLGARSSFLVHGKAMHKKCAGKVAKETMRQQLAIAKKRWGAKK
jgi:hypothetical protein